MPRKTKYKISKPRKIEAKKEDFNFDRIMEEILGDDFIADDLVLEGSDKEYILVKILESAERMVDSLEDAWELRPTSLSPEEEVRLLEAIERAKQLRNKIVDDLLPRAGLFIKDVAGEA